MQKIHAFFKILGLIFLCGLSQTGYSLGEKDYEARTQEGIRQLNALIAQNARNDAQGLSRQNQYVFTDKVVTRGEIEALLKGQGMTLEEINQKISDFHAKQTHGVEIYVYLTGFKGYVQGFDGEKIQFKIKEDGENGLTYERLSEQEEITLEEARRYEAKILYDIFSNSAIADKSKTAIFKHTAYLDVKSATKATHKRFHLHYSGKALEENRKNLLAQIKTQRQAGQKGLGLDIAAMVTHYEKPLEKQEDKIALDEVLFTSQISFNQSSQRFSGSVTLRDASTGRSGDQPDKHEDGRYVIADYVGLQGKTLSLNSDSETGKIFAQLADKIKICLTNPQSPQVVLDFLRKDLKATTPDTFGNFFDLQPGEMLLWVHFPEEGKQQVWFWFHNSTIPEVAQFLHNERQLFINQSFISGVLVMKHLADMLSETLKLGRIPEKYWNPRHKDYPKYMPVLVATLFMDARGLVQIGAEAITVSDIPLLTSSQIKFAFFAGAYNQVITEVGGIPDLVSFLGSYLSDQQVRQAVSDALSKDLLWKILVSIGEGAGKQLTTFSQLDASSAHLLGQDAVAVLALVVGVGEIKIAVKSGKFVQTLGTLALRNAKGYYRLVTRITKLPRKIVKYLRIKKIAENTAEILTPDGKRLGVIEGDVITRGELVDADDFPNHTVDAEGFRYQRQPAEAAPEEVHLVASKEGEPKGFCGPNGKKCFVAGTLIVLADYQLKNIEQIQEGDKVRSRNEATGQETIGIVEEVFVRQAHKLLKITTATDIFRTTPEHPFYIDGQWIKAKDLKKGDVLTLLDKGTLLASKGRFLPRSGLSVETIQPIDTTATVYNFSVREYHTYFVGESGVLVHNASGYGIDNLLNNTFNKWIIDGKEVWGGIKNIDEFSDIGFTASIDLNTKEFTALPTVKFDSEGIPLEKLYFRDGKTEIPVEFIKNRTGGHIAATNTLKTQLGVKGGITNPKMRMQNKNFLETKTNGDMILTNEVEKSALAGFAIIKNGKTLRITYKSNQLNKKWNGVVNPKTLKGAKIEDIIKNKESIVRNDGNIVPPWDDLQGRNYREEIKEAVRKYFPGYKIID